MRQIHLEILLSLEVVFHTQKKPHTHTHIYIYIYIYVCVCVVFFVCEKPLQGSVKFPNESVSFPTLSYSLEGK